MTRNVFIFDLDGVITDTAVYHYQAWKKMADSLGVPFDEHANEELKGVSRRDSLERILAGSSQQFSEEDKLRLMEQKNDDYVKLVGTLTHKDILPGVTECLKLLRERGFHIGLASASKNARSILERLGILEAFDYVADAAKIPNSKPAPDVFLDVMHAFGSRPDLCVGIEDAAAGVQAIKSAGMFAVGIGDQKILAQADIIFSDMQSFDLEEILRVS